MQSKLVRSVGGADSLNGDHHNRSRHSSAGLCRPLSLTGVRGYLIRCVVRIVVTSLASQVTFDATCGTFYIPTSTKSCTIHNAYSTAHQQLNTPSSSVKSIESPFRIAVTALYMMLANGSTITVEFSRRKFFLRGRWRCDPGEYLPPLLLSVPGIVCYVSTVQYTSFPWKESLWDVNARWL